jgi:hypothetical protein
MGIYALSVTRQNAVTGDLVFDLSDVERVG